MKSIPHQIRTSFKTFTDLYGENIVRIGERNGIEYFMFAFPEDSDTGFPQIVSFHNGKTESIGGIDAVQILASFNPED